MWQSPANSEQLVPVLDLFETFFYLERPHLAVFLVSKFVSQYSTPKIIKRG